MNNSKKISLGAIITIISTLLIYFTSVFPTVKLSLVSLASFLIAIAIIEISPSRALLVYATTAILSFILVPNKLILVPYILFLGYYPIIKYYIERLDNLILEWSLKLVVFNIVIFIGYLTFKTVIIKELNIDLPIWGIALVIQVVFIIYDYVFSLFISHYNKKIRKHLH